MGELKNVLKLLNKRGSILYTVAKGRRIIVQSSMFDLQGLLIAISHELLTMICIQRGN